MNGKIDNGILHIERRGKMRIQQCPLDDNVTACGDWCPLFGEPDMLDKSVIHYHEDGVRVGGCVLQLCKKQLYFKEFEVIA